MISARGVLAVVLTLAPTAAVASPIEVLSVVGMARAAGRSLGTGGIDAGKLLEVPRGATLQVLLPRRGRERDVLALSVAGPVVLRLDRASAEVTLVEGQGAVRLAGGGGAIERSGWRVVLGDAGATVVLQGQTLHVLVGRATLSAVPSTLDPVSRFVAGLGASSPPTTVAASRVAHLGLSTLQLGAGRPSGEVLSRLDALQPPPAWTPTIDEVTTAEVKRARRWTQQQRQAAREAASCGCTESRGSGAGPVAGKNAFNPLERTTTILKVKITDVPKRLP
jgi:hypothetical protein